jgi:hypothetical protein
MHKWICHQKTFRCIDPFQSTSQKNNPQYIPSPLKCHLHPLQMIHLQSQENHYPRLKETAVLLYLFAQKKGHQALLFLLLHPYGPLSHLSLGKNIYVKNI